MKSQMKRKTAASVEVNQPLSARRPSIKLKQTPQLYPKTNLLNRISQLSPQKIVRSSSTKLSSRLGRSQYQMFENDPFTSVNQKSQIQQVKISQSKTSKKSLGMIKAFATNLINNHNSMNETRISIVTSMKRQNTQYQNISLFAVFEGHNGNQCSTFLRDNLHVYISMEKSFPDDISKALEDGIKVAEMEYMKIARKVLCDAGSSFVVIIVKDQMMYIANIGDCRALGSLKLGEESINLTVDHTAHNQSQFNRILKKGGSISKQRDGQKIDFFVLPGYKRTTRSIGDYYYKSKHYGIILSDPTIRERKINSDLDFILLGTNRLFTFTNAKQMIKNMWICSMNDESENIHGKAGQLIKYLLSNVSKDINSLGAILLIFENYEKTFDNQEPENLPLFGE